MSGEGVNQVVTKKLDKHNFSIWKYWMPNFPMGKGNWEYIEGDLESSPEVDEYHPMAD